MISRLLFRDLPSKTTAYEPIVRSRTRLRKITPHAKGRLYLRERALTGATFFPRKRHVTPRSPFD
jgi:hypothetical protein